MNEDTRNIGGPMLDPSGRVLEAAAHAQAAGAGSERARRNAEKGGSKNFAVEHGARHLGASPPKRRISSLVAYSIGLLGCILIVVCVVSWVGLRGFQDSLSDITTTTLPRIQASVAGASQLSGLLINAEHLAQVETEAERRIAYREIQNQMTAAAAALQDKNGEGMPPQMEVLNAQLERLNAFTGRRLEINTQLEGVLERVEGVVQLVNMQADDFTAEVGSGEHRSMHERTAELVGLLMQCQRQVTGSRPVTPVQMERVIVRTLADIRKKAPESATKLLAAVDQAEDILLGADGLIPTLNTLMRVRSEIKSVHGISRGMLNDLNVSQITMFNGMMTQSRDIAANTADRLRQFARFFLLIALVALLLSIAVYVYFRRTFVARLEKLNGAVLAGVGGAMPEIDTAGTDEIATIAQSVDFFTRELKVSMQLAEASSKAKGAFLANMSHEIRTPMNAVIGFTRMVSKTRLDETQRDYITKIENSAQFLLSIINDILDFSKIEAGKLDIDMLPFNLRTIIDNAVAACEPKARAKNLDLRLQVDLGIPSVLIGDPVRIFQVLNNLCDNAVKFTESGGISLIVTLVEASATTAIVRFEVADQGIGLTEDQKARLFQPFTQADVSTTRRFGGTGLGLTICKSLCELMGGTIGVRSTYGSGSIFHFTLPFGVTSETLEDDAAVDDLETLDLTGRRILLVEDNAINQEIMLALLEATNVKTEVAENGEEAVAKAKNNDYNLILMDIQMPVMDGIAATKQIRALEHTGRATVPIIAMTAHAMNEDRQASLEAGMNDHLSKPVDLDALYAALARWIA